MYEIVSSRKGGIMVGVSAGLESWLKLSLLVKQKGIYQKDLFKPKLRIYLGNKLPTVYLTRREAQCVLLLMQNLSRYDIALRLGLSRRTIDTYIETAKKKLSSHSQNELLNKLKKTDFIKNCDHLTFE